MKTISEEELDEAMRRFRSHIRSEIERPFVRPRASYLTSKAYKVYGDTLEELHSNKEKMVKELILENNGG